MMPVSPPDGARIEAVRRAVAEMKAALDAFAETIAPALAERDDEGMREPLARVHAAQTGFHKSIRPVWGAVRAARPEWVTIGCIPLDLRTHNALERAGIWNLAQIEASLEAGTLAEAGGIGPTRLREIECAVVHQRAQLLAESTVA